MEVRVEVEEEEVVAMEVLVEVEEVVAEERELQKVSDVLA